MRDIMAGSGWNSGNKNENCEVFVCDETTTGCIQFFEANVCVLMSA